MNYRDKVDTERCYFCPKRNAIEVHHIVPQRFRGGDGRENLVAVCDKCHKKLERLYDQSFYSALGIDDVTDERAKHFPCIRCDERAVMKVRSNVGSKLWFCETHGHELADSQDHAEIVKEVSQ